MDLFTEMTRGLAMAGYSETVRRMVQGDFSDSTDDERSKAVEEVKQVCSIAAAAVTFQPIPLVDMALISPIQIAMVQAIGRVRGYRLDTRSVLEILSTFGTSILAQNAIIAAAKFIPFAGWVLSISMAYALTYAVGEVSDYYFRTGRGASSAELKALFKRVYQQKKAEKEAEHGEDTSLKQRLGQLKEAYAAELISEEEFEKKKQEILTGF